MDNQTKSPEEQILDYLNEIAGRRFKPIKANLKGISARFKDGYTMEQMKAVIMIKTLEWKNNEVMALHLDPVTLFRPSNFDKYMNQVLIVQAQPEKYKQYYEQLNNTASDPIDQMFK